MTKSITLSHLNMGNQMKCQVAILAGGKGARLSSHFNGIPKPMVPVAGLPILQHQIELCRRYGFTKIALLVQYHSNLIEDYFGDGSRFGVSLTYQNDGVPRGTAGALLNALNCLENTFLVLYADTYADVDLVKFWNFHNEKNGIATLLLHPNSHPQDSDIVEINDEAIVKNIHGYPHKNGVFYRNLVNAALYVINGEIIKAYIRDDVPSDLAKDIFPKLICDNKKIIGYVSSEYIKDMGTLERLRKVEKDIELGLPELLSVKSIKSAVFIDRDGTINLEVNGVRSPSELEVIPKAASGIRKLNEAGILALCVTNQPMLAKGQITIPQLERIHAKLDYELGASSAYLDGIYFCPHHPEAGYEGEIKELKINCSCRKPGIGLINKAISELNVSRELSWMIGDSTADILAGNKAGLRTILVRTGYGGRDLKYNCFPDYVFDDLHDAIDWILHGYKRTSEKIAPILSKLAGKKLILIGGCSRSGKSTLSQVIKDAISSSKSRCKILSLDCFLLPKEKRIEGAGVLSRYDVDKILELSNFLKLNIVDGMERKSFQIKINEIDILTIDKNDVLIVEGIPALLVKELRELTSVSIYINIDQEVRVTRFINEYKSRGDSLDEIKKKLISRNIDEVSEITKYAKYAQHIISMP